MKLKNILTEDYSQRARNFRVNLRKRLEAMKVGQTVGIGSYVFKKTGGLTFQYSKGGGKFNVENVVQTIQKGPAKPYIKTHRGADGATMVNAFLKFSK